VTNNRRRHIALVPVGCEITASTIWQYCCRAGWRRRHANQGNERLPNRILPTSSKLFDLREGERSSAKVGSSIASSTVVARLRYKHEFFFHQEIDFRTRTLLRSVHDGNVHQSGGHLIKSCGTSTWTRGAISRSERRIHRNQSGKRGCHRLTSANGQHCPVARRYAD
jgi:hypothetical protein